MKPIQPRTLKGFRDFLPTDMYLRQQVFSILRTTFQRYGFEPLETPALEYSDILLGKYGEEAEGLMYRFTDRGGRDVALKYDLTVPTCRVLAQYQNDLPLPFKRYQMQPVWRAENTQKGRFREFYQCDADTYGSESQIVEAEFIQMGVEVLQQLGFSDLRVRLNNRKIIDGIIQYADAPPEQFEQICIIIDKLDKVGLMAIQTELRQKGLSENVIDKLTEVISLPQDTALTLLEKKLTSIPIAQEGIQEIFAIMQYLEAAGVPAGSYRFDPTIIRGLSYYTGPVWEFDIEGGDVGSVGGGGRYDVLVKTYSGKDIPAAGGSFGVERIIEIMKARATRKDNTETDVLVTVPTTTDIPKAIRIAHYLRTNGLPGNLQLSKPKSENKSAPLTQVHVSLYAKPGTKLEKQLKYADKKQIPLVVILLDEEDENKYTLKDMRSGEQKPLAISFD